MEKFSEKKKKGTGKIEASTSGEKNFSEVILERMSEVVSELVYISETDADFQVFCFPFSGEKELKNLARADRCDSIAEIEYVNFDRFFDRLTAGREWHREIEKKRVDKFKQLRDLLKDSFSDLTVLKIGKIRREIFVYGKLSADQICGIRTYSVET